MIIAMLALRDTSCTRILFCYGRRTNWETLERMVERKRLMKAMKNDGLIATKSKCQTALSHMSKIHFCLRNDQIKHFLLISILKTLIKSHCAHSITQHNKISDTVHNLCHKHSLRYSHSLLSGRVEVFL